MSSILRTDDIQNSLGTGKPTVNSETIVTAEATQTISGQKTFTAPIKVVDAVNVDEVVNKGQLDTSIGISNIFNSKDISNIVYDENNLITSITYADGSKADYSYDVDSNLSQIDFFDTDGLTLIGTQTFTYDVNGYLMTTNYTGV